MSLSAKEIAGIVQKPKRGRGQGRVKNFENYARGADHYRASLTDDQVYRIRIRYFEVQEEDQHLHVTQRRGYKFVGDEFGVSRWTVRELVKGRTRREAGGPIYEALS